MNEPSRVRWYQSISTRLLVVTALLIVSIVGAVLWQWATSAQRLVREQTRQEGGAVAQAMALPLTSEIADQNFSQARIAIDLLIQRDADIAYVLITDERSPQIVLAIPEDQEQRYVSDLVPLWVSRAAVREGEPRFAETNLLHDVTYAGRTSRAGDAVIEVAQDLRFTTMRFGVLRVGISLKRGDQVIATTLRQAIFGVGACLAVALLAAYVMARRITAPIVALSKLMARVGSGDLELEASVRGKHEIAHLGRSFNGMLAGLRQKRLLEKYVPKGARRDIDDKEGKLQLGGRRIRAAILFSDLRGFTSLSERLSPQEVVAILNEYLEMMTEAIVKYDGDINEYVGDAVLAVFSCEDGVNGALSAVRAAWAMQENLRALQLRTKNDEVRKLKMGIGVHVGDVVLGNIGSRDRVKWGVVGDTVNLSARIQDRSRDGTFTCIFISDEAHDALGGEFRAAALGEVAFKGKATPVAIWEIEARAKTTERPPGLG